jgi:hypothetical protein
MVLIWSFRTETYLAAKLTYYCCKVKRLMVLHIIDWVDLNRKPGMCICYVSGMKLIIGCITPSLNARIWQK